MKVSKDNLYSIASDLKIPKEKIEALWTGLEKLEGAPEETHFTKYLFYFGAMIVISAMTWLMNLGWELLGGGGLFLLSTAYAALFVFIGNMLWDKKGLRIPAGLLVTIAVCMVPLAIYGLETYFDLWPTLNQDLYSDFYSWVEGKWVYMEIGTILAGILALRFFPFPFITAPIFFAFWFLTMDIVPFFFGEGVGFETKSWVSLILGLVMLVIGFLLDRGKKRDFAFWSYLFGTLSFWGGLGCLMWERGEVALFFYFLINLSMMLLSVLLRRNVLMIFGAIGVFAYLSHLAHNLFEDSVLFPFALSFIGLGVIYLGVLYQKNLGWIEKNILEKLPPSLRALSSKE